MNNSKNNLKSGVFNVVDTIAVMKQGLGGILFIAFGIFLFSGMPLIGSGMLFVGAILTCSIPAELKGVILNINNDTMEFPGAGLSANSFSDYLKPEFILKRFKRFTVPITSITQISTKRTSKVDKEGRATIKYHLIVVGSFGSLKLTFDTEVKRDELYSLIRDINEMGTPVFEA